MIEIIVWLFTLFATGIAMLLNKDYASRIGGLSYITVGVAALLGLYINYDNVLLMTALSEFISSWFIIEVFIFLNIITGYNFYARYRRHT